MLIHVSLFKDSSDVHELLNRKTFPYMVLLLQLDQKSKSHDLYIYIYT